MKITTLCVLLLAMLSLQPELHANPSSLTLWYQQPASDWMTEALPIGNGHLGAMIFGGMKKEHIQSTKKVYGLAMNRRRELTDEDPDAVVITDKAKSFDRFAWQAAGKPLCFCCTPNGEGTGYDFTKTISNPGDQQWLGIVQHMTYDTYLVDARASAYDTDPAVTTHC